MIKVYFDGTLIDSSYINALSYSANPYVSKFEIGNTVCRQFSISVLNAGYSSVPNSVTIYEDSTLFATMQVDSYDEENELYTTFNLVDKMVEFNKDLTYTVGNTVLQILTAICTAHSISLATQSFYMSDLAITWTDEITERAFISYVAEVNGGYARINASGNLEIVSYTNTTSNEIEMNECSSFKLGTLHRYDRVYVELASATKYYPSTNQYDTLYLNPDNILFTDSGTYTIDATIQHIYSVVNDFKFYNCKIEKCPLSGSIDCGEIVNIKKDSSTSYPILATIDWEYTAGWKGGFDLDLVSSNQEETLIVSPTKKINRIEIKVDRDEGRIDQILSDASGHTGSFSLYLNENDPDDVISCINASADNIILNTKSLIFGDYPSGKYIEAKQWSTSPKGMTMVGNGTVHIEPKGGFYVDNQYTLNSTTYKGNNIDISNEEMYGEESGTRYLATHENSIEIYNYTSLQSSQYANMIDASSRSRWETPSGTFISGASNQIRMYNNKVDASGYGNEFNMYHSESNANYDSCRAYVLNRHPGISCDSNLLELLTSPLSTGDYNSYARLFNYNGNEHGTGSQLYSANILELNSVYESSLTRYTNEVKLINYSPENGQRNTEKNYLRLNVNEDGSYARIHNVGPTTASNWYNDIYCWCNSANGRSTLNLENYSNSSWYNTMYMYAIPDDQTIFRLQNASSSYTGQVQINNYSSSCTVSLDVLAGSTVKSSIDLYQSGNISIDATGTLTLQGNSGIQLNGYTLSFSGGYVKYS